MSERGEILQIVTQSKQWLSKIASEGICLYVQQHRELVTFASHFLVIARNQLKYFIMSFYLFIYLFVVVVVVFFFIFKVSYLSCFLKNDETTLFQGKPRAVEKERYTTIQDKIVGQ